MIKAKYRDKPLILEMMQSSFEQNPTFRSITKDPKRPYLKRLLIEWAFHFAYARNGVYLSENKTCCAFFYHSSESGGLLEIWYKLKFILLGIRWSKILDIMHHFGKINKAKPKDRCHYHFWFLGSTRDSSFSSTKTFINDLFQLATIQDAPIFAETTLDKNRTVFARYGMKVFAKVETAKLNLRAYLMYWKPRYIS